mgnify:CR=1 FL=1
MSQRHDGLENQGRLIMSAEQLRRALVRISHEILERNSGTQGMVLVGMHTRGVPLASRLARSISEFEGENVPMGALDISLYRDDVSGGAKPLIRPTDIPIDIQGRRVVLVDDVFEEAVSGRCPVMRAPVSAPGGLIHDPVALGAALATC